MHSGTQSRRLRDTARPEGSTMSGYPDCGTSLALEPQSKTRMRSYDRVRPQRKELQIQRSCPHIHAIPRSGRLFARSGATFRTLTKQTKQMKQRHERNKTNEANEADEADEANETNGATTRTTHMKQGHVRDERSIVSRARTVRLCRLRFALFGTWLPSPIFSHVSATCDSPPHPLVHSSALEVSQIQSNDSALGTCSSNFAHIGMLFLPYVIILH